MKILTVKTDWKKMLKGKSERKINSAFHNHCLKKGYEYIPLKKLAIRKKSCIPRGRMLLMRKRIKVYKQVLNKPCNEKFKEKIVEIEKQLLASHWSKKEKYGGKSG